MKLFLEGTVWAVKVEEKRKKDGTAFNVATVSVLQEGEPRPSLVKMPAEKAPAEGEKVLLAVYPSGWVGKNGQVNVDLHLSGR